MTQFERRTNRGEPRPPLHPYIVLALSILLPGAGQVLNNQTTRGAIMVFFMLTLGIVTYHLTTPEHSFVGRHAGAFFIYSISVLDAYKWARYRWALFWKARLESGQAKG